MLAMMIVNAQVERSIPISKLPTPSEADIWGMIAAGSDSVVTLTARASERMPVAASGKLRAPRAVCTGRTAVSVVSVMPRS